MEAIGVDVFIEKRKQVMLNQNVGVEGKKVFKMLPLPLDEEGGGDN